MLKMVNGNCLWLKWTRLVVVVLVWIVSGGNNLTGATPYYVWFFRDAQCSNYVSTVARNDCTGSVSGADPSTYENFTLIPYPTLPYRSVYQGDCPNGVIKTFPYESGVGL
jgi:hypothetical protein